MADYRKDGVANTLSEFQSIISTRCPVVPIHGFGYSGSESSTMCTVFRGHADKMYELVPSVFRKNYLKYENKILEKGLECVGAEFPDVKSEFDKLAVMQHYGLPTRLLDFTLKPLVALYFACCEHPDKDGQVIMLRANEHEIDTIEIKTVLKFVSLEPDLNDFGEKLREKLERNIPIQRLEGILNEDYLVFPYISNPRLKLQGGVFVVFGQRSSYSMGKIPSNLLKDNEPIMRGYISYIDIPASAKECILSELATKGIDHSAVYPDGLSWKKMLEEIIKNDKT